VLAGWDLEKSLLSNSQDMNYVISLRLAEDMLDMPRSAFENRQSELYEYCDNLYSFWRKPDMIISPV